MMIGAPGLQAYSGDVDDYAPFLHRTHMWNMRLKALNGSVPVSAFSTGNAIAAIGYAHRPFKVQGIGIPIITKYTSGNIKFNMGLYTTVAGSGTDVKPGALVHADAWGEATTNETVSDQRIHTLSFQNTVILPRGPFFFCGAYQDNTANGVVFEGISIVRSDGAVNSAASGYNRYDMNSSTAPSYASTDMSATLIGLTWQDSGSSSVLAQNINFALWLEE